MDKRQNAKPKNNNNLLRMLPKAMSFGQRLRPFSPGRDLHHHQTTATASSSGNKSFLSGPIIRLVPVESRDRRIKKDDVLEEPTSPKVSCIGQIKLTQTKCSEKKKKKDRTSPAISRNSETTSSSSKTKEKGRGSMIKRMFSSAVVKPPRKHITAVAAAAESDRPSLGTMKKFASSRDVLAGFDWEAEMKGEESPAADRHRDYYSDSETRVISFSAPLTLNRTEGLKPKKEVNLWKRRTMDPPRHLQIRES